MQVGSLISLPQTTVWSTVGGSNYRENHYCNILVSVCPSFIILVYYGPSCISLGGRTSCMGTASDPLFLEIHGPGKGARRISSSISSPHLSSCLSPPSPSTWQVSPWSTSLYWSQCLHFGSSDRWHTGASLSVSCPIQQYVNMYNSDYSLGRIINSGV